MNTSQKGTVGLLIGIMIGILLAGGGFYIYKKSVSNSNSRNGSDGSWVDSRTDSKSEVATKLYNEKTAKPYTTTRTDLKTFNSSVNGDDFNHSEFKYPDSWTLYHDPIMDHDRVFLSKNKDIDPKKIFESFTQNRSGEPYIFNHTTADVYTHEVIEKFLGGKNIKDVILGNKKVTRFTGKDIDGPEQYIAYMFYSQYINMGTISVFIQSKDGKFSEQDIKDVEEIVKSYRILETERGAKERANRGPMEDR